MSLFYKLLVVVLISALAVLGYDLFQAEIEQPRGAAGIFYGVRDGRVTLSRPAGSVRIVYASMFGPGEPVMRVRDHWINEFEREYSDRLSADPAYAAGPEQRRRFAAGVLREAGGTIGEARRRLDAIDALSGEDRKTRTIEKTIAWLGGRNVFLADLPPEAGAGEKAEALRKLLDALEALGRDPEGPAKVRVVPRVEVRVERRWQGRWVLSANRPRFLTGREVPDIMVGSKMELLALVQDGYAVPLNEPLPGESVSPLDGADTYGDPSRKWRDAFIPAMLQEGKYDFLDDPAVKGKVFLPPLTCFTYCIFYNEVLFERAGIDKPPRTWPEFMAVCAKLKDAGICPLTADQDVYCDSWFMWLTFRILGPEAWEGTVVGVPADKPPRQRRSEPPWTDPRHHQVHAQVRALRERGYFDEDFRGSTWPAAQRAFASGSAAMMICGSWLVQELAGYKDTASAEKFRLNCFSFPTWPGGRERDQSAAYAGVFGLMVCRQGGATRHAVELVKYLSAKDHRDMVHKNAQISCMIDADFPPALGGIAEDFRAAPLVYSRIPNIYARRFNAATLSPLTREFFLKEKGESGYISVEAFLRTLHKESSEYLRNGGEEGYE